MAEIALTASTFIGGLFIGALAGLLFFVVFNLIKEALEKPSEMLIPSFLLLCIFGTALVYAIGISFGNWILLTGALLSFSYSVRGLVGPEKTNTRDK